MKSTYLKGKFELVEETIDKARKARQFYPEVLDSMLGSYLVVFLSGIYEDCIEHLLIERAGQSNDKELESLVKELVHRQFRNPFYAKIKELIKGLNPSYGVRLDSAVPNESILAIDSIVNNKNDIAHGRTCNVTFNDVCNYHNRSKAIFDALEKML